VPLLGVDIPTDFDVDVSIAPPLPPINVSGIGPVGPVSISGIPDTFHMHIEELPKIQIGVDPLDMNIRPVDISLRMKEMPSIRGHLPADFSVGLSLLGLELMNVRLCGEAQIITEPYEPNPCEICGHPHSSEKYEDPQT
jgi:hypothetical protein